MHTISRCAVIADVQYADIGDSKSRFYRRSADKLRRIMRSIEGMGVDFVLQLGDLIDQRFGSFDSVVPIFQEAPVPVFHVLGNHDFSVEPSDLGRVVSRIGLKSRYYETAVGRWRFVILDGTDISLFAHLEGSAENRSARAMIEVLQSSGAPNAHPWNGAVGATQITWLEGVLRRSAEAGESVAVVCHFPVLTEDNRHTLLNSNRIRELVGRFDNVALFLAGHDHRGSYHRDHHIHFLTVKGLVETDQEPWSIISFAETSIEVSGFGNEPTRVLSLTSPVAPDT